MSRALSHYCHGGSHSRSNSHSTVVSVVFSIRSLGQGYRRGECYSACESVVDAISIANVRAIVDAIAIVHTFVALRLRPLFARRIYTHMRRSLCRTLHRIFNCLSQACIFVSIHLITRPPSYGYMYLVCCVPRCCHL
jgi:hypothetical protein